jgi:uncharacterized protein YjiK
MIKYIPLFLLLACNTPQKPATPQDATASIVSPHYDLNHPDTTFTMPKSLTEISALTLSPFANKLATVSDEKGDLFFINKYTGAVDTPSIHFAPDGDFEGLEFVGTTAYAIKSKGKIYEITDAATLNQKVVVHKTSLSKDDNIEGLGYDKKNNRLLLAAKGQKDPPEAKKYVYAFDLNTKELVAEPIFTIQVADIISRIPTNDQQPTTNDIGPSALAVHPISGDIYILSSIGKLLIILTEKGTIKEVRVLDKKIHVQPEGLTFDADGTMYISNEGKTGMGKLHVFKMKK